MSIPFFKATAISEYSQAVTWIGPIAYLVFIIFVLLGSSNAVNLTDGMDGLASSVTFIAMSALTALTYVSSDARWSSYLDITHKPEAAELTVFCGAMVGASLGFLWHNAPPAEVFMGDVGSLAIGGALGTMAILTKQEFLLPFIGGVFIIEARFGDVAGFVFQIHETHGGQRQTDFFAGSAASSFSASGLERTENRFSVRDYCDSFRAFEFINIEIALIN